jgi:hypothetical protein
MGRGHPAWRLLRGGSVTTGRRGEAPTSGGRRNGELQDDTHVDFVPNRSAGVPQGGPERGRAGGRPGGRMRGQAIPSVRRAGTGLAGARPAGGDQQPVPGRGGLRRNRRCVASDRDRARPRLDSPRDPGGGGPAVGRVLPARARHRVGGRRRLSERAHPGGLGRCDPASSRQRAPYVELVPSARYLDGTGASEKPRRALSHSRVMSRSSASPFSAVASVGSPKSPVSE